jgi:hypothetical protein
VAPAEMLLRVQDLLHQENLPAVQSLVGALAAKLSVSTEAGAMVIAGIVKADYLLRQRDIEAARAAVGNARRAAKNEPGLVAPTLVRLAAIDMRVDFLDDARELVTDALRLAEEAEGLSCAADAAFNLGPIEAHGNWESSVSRWDGELARAGCAGQPQAGRVCFPSRPGVLLCGLNTRSGLRAIHPDSGMTSAKWR